MRKTTTAIAAPPKNPAWPADNPKRLGLDGLRYIAEALIIPKLTPPAKMAVAAASVVSSSAPKTGNKNLATPYKRTPQNNPCANAPTTCPVVPWIPKVAFPLATFPTPSKIVPFPSAPAVVVSLFGPCATYLLNQL